MWHGEDLGNEEKATLVTEEEWDEETEMMNESCKHNNKRCDILYFTASGSLNYINSDRNYPKDGKRAIKGPAGFKGGSLGDIHEDDFHYCATRQNRSSCKKLMELKWEMTLAAKTKSRLKKDENNGESTIKDGAANTGISSFAHCEAISDLQTQQELAPAGNTTRSTNFETNVSSAARNEGAANVQSKEATTPKRYSALNNNREVCKGLVVPIISGFSYLLRDTQPLSKQQRRRIREKQTQLKLRLRKEAEKQTRLEAINNEATKINGHGDEAGADDIKNQDDARCEFEGIEAKVRRLFRIVKLTKYSVSCKVNEALEQALKNSISAS